MEKIWTLGPSATGCRALCGNPRLPFSWLGLGSRPSLHGYSGSAYAGRNSFGPRPNPRPLPPFVDTTAGLINLCRETQMHVPAVQAMPATNSSRKPEDKGATPPETGGRHSDTHALGRYSYEKFPVAAIGIPRFPPKQALHQWKQVPRKMIRTMAAPITGPRGNSPATCDKNAPPSGLRGGYR